MKSMCLLLALAPNLLALDVTTLDGKSYRDCQISTVYPDSICVLFSGGGARIKFANLPESVRAQYGFDAQRAADFEQAETARIARQQAILNAQRIQAAAQKAATAANQAPRSQLPGTNSGAEYARVALAGSGTSGGNNQSFNRSGNQSGSQFGGGFAGAQYVGVRMAGIRGVTVPAATQARPPGTAVP